MFPLTPDQHHWLDVATEDEGWCSFRSCTPSRSRARTEFTKWQHTAMWYLALGWHATDFTQTFAILQFYICFRFRSHHRSRHVILHQSSKFYPNRTGRKNDVMSIFKLADLSHLGFWKDVNRHHSYKLLSFWEKPVSTFWRQDPRLRISAILDFRGPVMGLWKAHVRLPIGRQ